MSDNGPLGSGAPVCTFSPEHNLTEWYKVNITDANGELSGHHLSTGRTHLQRWGDLGPHLQSFTKHVLRRGALNNNLEMKCASTPLLPWEPTAKRDIT